MEPEELRRGGDERERERERLAKIDETRRVESMRVSFILRAVSQKIDDAPRRARARPPETARRPGPRARHLLVDRSFRRSFRRSSSSTRTRSSSTSFSAVGAASRASLRGPPRRRVRRAAPRVVSPGLWKYPGAGRSRRRRWGSWGRVGVRPAAGGARLGESLRASSARAGPSRRAPRGPLFSWTRPITRSPPPVFRATTPRRRSRVRGSRLACSGRLRASRRSLVRGPPRRSPPGTSRRPPLGDHAPDATEPFGIVNDELAAISGHSRLGGPRPGPGWRRRRSISSASAPRANACARPSPPRLYEQRARYETSAADEPPPPPRGALRTTPPRMPFPTTRGGGSSGWRR